MHALWWRIPTPFNKKNYDHNQKCRELRMTLVAKPWLQNCGDIPNCLQGLEHIVLTSVYAKRSNDIGKFVYEDNAVCFNSTVYLLVAYFTMLSDYTVLKHRMISRIMNWRRWSQPDQR
jgi:hypothetical protein